MVTPDSNPRSTDNPCTSSARVLIELSSAQIDQVARAAMSQRPAIPLLPRITCVPVHIDPRWREDIKLSQSLLNGLMILASLPEDGSPVGNNEVALLVDLTPSTAHRYLRTLLAVGLIDRDPYTRKYRRTLASDTPQAKR
jgi:hypothetical protein